MVDREDHDAPCTLTLCGWTAQGVRCGQKAGVKIAVELVPFNVHAETGFAVVDDSSDDHQTGVDAVWSNEDTKSKIKINYPGTDETWTKLPPYLTISVVEQLRRSAWNREKEVATLATSSVSVAALLQMLEEENPTRLSLDLEPQGRLHLTIAASFSVKMSVKQHVPRLQLERQTARDAAEQKRQARLEMHEQRAYSSKRRPSAIRTVDLHELMDKLRQRYENARRGILGDRPFASAFYAFDPTQSGAVSRPDFVKGLHKLEIRLTIQETGVLMTMLQDTKDVQNQRDAHVRYVDLEDHILRHMAQDNRPVSPTGEILKADEDVRAKLSLLVKNAQAKGLSPEKTFAHFDKYQSGSISKHDFQLGLEQLGFVFSVRELVALMAELDQDGNGMISLREFVRFARGKTSPVPSRTRVRALGSSHNEADGSYQAFNKRDDEQKQQNERENNRESKSQERGHRVTRGNGEKTSPQLGKHGQKLMTENAQLRAAMEKCTARIAKLEARCARAESQNHSVVRRTRRKAAAEERARVQQHFVDLIKDAIDENFDEQAASEDDADDYSDDEDRRVAREERKCEEGLREQAHIAFERMLEKQIADLRDQQATQLRQLLKAENQVAEADLRSQRMQAFVLRHRELFAPKIAELSIRTTLVARNFVARFVQAGLSSCAKLFAGYSSAPLSKLQEIISPTALSHADMVLLNSELGPQGKSWCGQEILILDDNDNVEGYNLVALAEALDRCHAWDLQTLLEGPTPELTRPPGAPVQASQLPSRLAEIVRAALSSKERTGIGAREWFQDIPVPDWTTWERMALTLDELNDDLEFAHAPHFYDASELETALAWLRDNWPHCNGHALYERWAEEGLVALRDFALAIDTLCADMRIQQELELLQKRVMWPDVATNEFSLASETSTDQRGPNANAISRLQPERLLTRFSSTEHSMCWPPLSKFGREPYDCVRLLDDGSTAEHNSSKARSVLVFVSGSPGRGEQNGVILRMNKDVVGSGAWGLCVTTQGPANRPVRGSALYLHTGEARVEGVSGEGKDFPALITDLAEDAIFLEDHAIMAAPRLENALDQGSCADKEILTNVYSHLVPAHILRDVISRSCELVDDHTRNNQSREWSRHEILIWKARELECRIRLQYREETLHGIKVDHWTMEREYMEILSSGQHVDGSLAANRLFHDLKETVEGHHWQSLLKVARGESSSLKAFINKMEKFQEGLREALQLSERQLSDFCKSAQRLINKRQQVHHSHFCSLHFRDHLAATIDIERNSVAFYVNGVLQTSLTPVCPQPWRFAWYTNRAGSASIVQA